MIHVKTISVLALAGAVATGCLVPQARYDELAHQHALEKEKATKLNQELVDLGKQLGETRTALDKVESRLTGSESELAKKQASLETNSQTLAEAEYESSVKETEKQAAEGMVTQLREELTRIASHIATLSTAKDQLRDERDKLQIQVLELDKRVKSMEASSAGAAARAELVQQLTLKLAEPIRAGQLQLDTQNDVVNLRCLSSALFDAKSGAVSVEGKKLLTLLGKALAPMALQVQVSELAAERTIAVREGHIRQVAGELRSSGVALERLTMRDDAGRAPSAAGKKSEPQMLLRLKPVERAAAAG